MSAALLAVVSAALLCCAAAAAERRPALGEARKAARAAVLQHPTYRSIDSRHPLVTRSCRRAGRKVRCSLYRWAPTPCALEGSDDVCIQVMTRRIWLVVVKLRRGRVVARVTRTSDSYSSPGESDSSTSSS